MSLSINSEEIDDDNDLEDRNNGIADGSSDPLLANYDNPRITSSRTSLRNDRSYTGVSAAIFLTVNAALGAGLLNIPYAFNESGGILYATIIQCFLVIFIIGSLFILTYLSDICNAIAYHELVEAFCGSKLKHLCSASIILYSYGACLTFIIIIGDQFDRIFLSLHGPDFCHYWYMNRQFLMLGASTILILPLSFSKRIDFLKYTSSFGVIATLYILFLSFYEYLKLNPQNVIIKTKPNSWTETFYVIPVICFSYQCHISWIPTYAGMKERSGSIKIGITIVVSMLICFVCYTITAIFGLFTFGSNNIKSDLMENYDATDGIVIAGIILLIAKTVTIYPILLYCGRLAIEDFLSKIFRFESSSPYEFHRRFMVVIIWFFSTIVIAILVPNLSLAINLLGSLAAIFVFSLPGLCLIIAILRKDINLYLYKDKLYVFIGAFYIILGVFIFGLTLAQVFRRDSDTNHNDSPLCY